VVPAAPDLALNAVPDAAPEPDLAPEEAVPDEPALDDANGRSSVSLRRRPR